MGTLSGDSPDPKVPGVIGTNAGGKSGLDTPAGWGVEGIMGTDPKVFSDDLFGGGVLGVSNAGFGVAGASSASAGVSGFASAGLAGVEGSILPNGVSGTGVQGNGGTVGVSGIGHAFGVKGTTFDLTANISGFLAGRDPIFQQHAGVYGQSDQQGVIGHGTADNATGVFGNSTGNGFGVRGESTEGVAIQGRSFGRNQGLAARFIGNVHIQGNPGTSSGDLRVEGPSSFGGTVICDGNLKAFDVTLAGGDCAEDFEIAGLEAVDPGTVMVVGCGGALRPCHDAYDKKVTGVISGAGGYKPGIVLDKRPSAPNRLPLALVGKVYCKVDAEFGAVEVGDLLTTSATHGHAMKASDPTKAFGAVIGKALSPLLTGRGLIPILVALQ